MIPTKSLGEEVARFVQTLYLIYKGTKLMNLKDFLGVPSARLSRSSRKQSSPFRGPPEQKIANVIIAKRLNEAHQNVQIQALEVGVLPRPLVFS